MDSLKQQQQQNTKCMGFLGQGHWKWNEKLYLNESYHHANFDIYHIYSVWENPNVKVFDKLRHLTEKKTLLIISLEYTSELHWSYCTWSF